MNIKLKLNEIVIKIQSIEQSLHETNKELVFLTSLVQETVISDNAYLMKKMKYDDIVFDDPNTWIHIKEIPEEVLCKWGSRLWLFQKTTFTYSRKDEFETLLGLKGRKAIDQWFWTYDSFIKSIICHPISIDDHCIRLKRSYTDGTSVSKLYLKQFFDMLEEEVLMYENK